LRIPTIVTACTENRDRLLVRPSVGARSGPNRRFRGRFGSKTGRHRPAKRWFAGEIEPNSIMATIWQSGSLKTSRYSRCP